MMTSCGEMATIIELNFKNQYSHFHAPSERLQNTHRVARECKRMQRGVRSAQIHALGS